MGPSPHGAAHVLAALHVEHARDVAARILDALLFADDVESRLLKQILCVVTSDAKLQIRETHEAAHLPRVEQELLGDFEAAVRRLDLDFH